MVKLPQEIQDKILLKLDWETLERSRDLQSEYVKNRTQFKTITEAALHGNLENMKWLKSIGCHWDTDVFAVAAAKGNLEIMKWLRENDCPWDFRPFSYATRQGNLENMKWLYSNDCIPYFDAYKAYPENVRWLKEVGLFDRHVLPFGPTRSRCPWLKETS